LDSFPKVLLPTGEGVGEGSITGVGDMNGDGTEDFAVAYPGTGIVYVIFGTHQASPTFDFQAGPNGVDSFKIEGLIDEEFGYSLAGGFDLNSDGFDDLAIGAPSALDKGGKAYIIFGSDTFDPVMNSTILDGKTGVEIVNGVIEDRVTHCGETYNPADHNDVPNVCPTDDATAFGIAMASVGDVNDDGLHDIVIGSNGGSVGGVVIFGRALGEEWNKELQLKDCLGHSVCTRIVSGDDDDNPFLGIKLGNSVAGGIDFNNDGMSDFIIGSPGSKMSQNVEAGMAVVVYGTDIQFDAKTSMKTLDGSTGYLIQGPKAQASEGAQLGWAVAALRAQDKDEAGNFVVSAPGNGDDEGMVYLLFGYVFDEITAETTKSYTYALPQVTDDLFIGPQDKSGDCAHDTAAPTYVLEDADGMIFVGDPYFGMSLSAADINGDNIDDILVGGENSVTVLYGQSHKANYTFNHVEVLSGDLTAQGDTVCERWKLSFPADCVCQYVDVRKDDNNTHISTSLVSSAANYGKAISSLGDINKDGIDDFGVQLGDDFAIVLGECDANDPGCGYLEQLPDGCTQNVAKLMVGFIDDDFVTWGMGYIRYVMEQMESEVRDAWDENMIQKGFYVAPDETDANLRCWCHPPDADSKYSCFDMEDLVCSAEKRTLTPATE